MQWLCIILNSKMSSLNSTKQKRIVTALQTARKTKKLLSNSFTYLFPKNKS